METNKPTEKTIGDFTVAVEPTDKLNGPFAVVVYGSGRPRTLACRFRTEEEAAEYLSGVSSRTLMAR